MVPVDSSVKSTLNGAFPLVGTALKLADAGRPARVADMYLIKVQVSPGEVSCPEFSMDSAFPLN
jgi:hypothetical protein